MKKNPIILKFLGIALLLLHAMVFVSCSKDYGDIDPNNPYAYLADATTEEVENKLQELCGNENADINQLISTLKSNNNIDDAYASDDGQSLIMKYKDDNFYTVYPVNMIGDPFEENYETNGKQRILTQTTNERKDTPSFRNTGSRGVVAVFNYFSNQDTRTTQNKILEYMMQDLNEHDYGVEYYPYEKMTIKNFENVKNNSTNYRAVIIISHGFSDSNKKKSYFTIGEKFTEKKAQEHGLIADKGVTSEKQPLYYQVYNAFGGDERKDCVIPVSNMELNEDVILYMGSCDAYRNKLDQDMKGTHIGWTGPNVSAQAHVAVLFYSLMRGKPLKDALEINNKQNPYYDITGEEYDIWGQDPIYDNSRMLVALRGINTNNYGGTIYAGRSDVVYLAPVTSYYQDAHIYVSTPYSLGIYYPTEKKISMNFFMRDDGKRSEDLYPKKIYIKITPLRSDADPEIYTLKFNYKKRTYSNLSFKLSKNGVYSFTAALDKNFQNEIKIYHPLFFIFGAPFKENGILINDEFEEDEDPAVEEGLCPDSNHPHIIDMGEAGKWACCNVGADAPWEYGGYYAWGETEEKDSYDFVYYSTKWDDAEYDIAGSDYDVAHVKWGDNWCMPNKNQLNLLLTSCTSEWKTINGIKGCLFNSPNGSNIFLPAAGGINKTNNYRVGELCLYHSSEKTISSGTHCFFSLDCEEDYKNVLKNESLFDGFPVRSIWIESNQSGGGNGH